MKVVNTIMDSFFVDYCVENHWSIPVKWFVIGPTPTGKRTDVEYCRARAAQEPNSPLYQSIMDSNVWVIHRYYKEFATTILEARANGIKVYIQTWGPDLLQSDTSHRELHDRATLRMAHQHGLQPTSNIIQKLYRKYYWNRQNAIHRKAFSLCSGIMFVTPVESVPFNAQINHMGEYRFVVNDERPEKGPLQKRKRLMLGHCAWTTMNHFDAIDQLASISHTLEEVLIPMTYGANNPYKDAIISHAKAKLNCPIVTLRDMLPRAEFESILSNYGTFMHHANRQQAIVNVMNFIYREGEIIVKPNQPVARFLEYLKIPHHTSTKSFAENPLSSDQKSLSRAKFHEFTSTRNKQAEERILNT